MYKFWSLDAIYIMYVRSKKKFKKMANDIHSSDVYMADLESALVFTFSREIPMKREISDKRLDALRNFIHLLYKVCI